MANSVRSSKKPRTICSSRGDSLSERAISTHACLLNIAVLGACRRERASLLLFARLFTTPSSMSHGKAAVHRIRFWRYCHPIRLKSKPLSVVSETPTRLGSQVCNGEETIDSTAPPQSRLRLPRRQLVGVFIKMHWYHHWHIHFWREEWQNVGSWRSGPVGMPKSQPRDGTRIGICA